MKIIDMLVKRGTYKSRDEAIRKMLSAQLADELSEDENVEELVREMLEAKKQTGRDPFKLKLGKSATETVAEIRN